MRPQTVEEIYAINGKVRQRLILNLTEVSDTDAVAITEDGSWSIAMVAEHVSMVDEGMLRICSKLLQKAESEGILSDGRAQVTNSFLERTAEVADSKLKAPEFVEPTGERSLPQSIVKLIENEGHFDSLKEKFERFDSSKHSFPHPYFGALNAHDWLVLRGGHEMRHIRQIERIRKMIEQ